MPVDGSPLSSSHTHPPRVLKATFRPNGFLTLQAFHGRAAGPVLLHASHDTWQFNVGIPPSHQLNSHLPRQCTPPKNKHFLLPRYFFESMMFLFFRVGHGPPSLKGMPLMSYHVGHPQLLSSPINGWPSHRCWASHLAHLHCCQTSEMPRMPTSHRTTWKSKQLHRPEKT